MLDDSLIGHERGVRRRVLALLVVMSAIVYLQRLSIAAVASDAANELHLSKSKLGLVFSAFTFFYALFEVPGGWLGDRFGTRRTLSWLAAAWSASTAATGAAMGLVSLVAARSFLGATEAGAFPNAACTISRWFPSSERGRALGTTFLGLSVGAAITTPLLLWLAAINGWRLAMVEAALPGLIWAAVWFRFFRDLPAQHPAVTSSELVHIGSANVSPHHREARMLRTLVQAANLWRICGVYFAFGYGIYFYITWMPTYLTEARGFSRLETATWSAMLWIMGGLGYIIGGHTTDWLERRYGSLKISRCWLGASAYAASAVSLLVVATTSVPVAAAVALSMAAFCQFFAAPSVWSLCIDIDHERAGSATGFMNMIGNIGGIIGPLVVGFSIDRFASWTPPFIITVVLFALGISMWLSIDVTTKLKVTVD